MNQTVRIACLPMCSGPEVAENLANMESALESGPTLDVLFLPENFAQMPRHRAEQHIELDGDGSVQQALACLAKKFSIHIVAGSLAVNDLPDTKPFARCLVFDPSGQRIAHYDKLHLFDVDTGSSQSQKKYRESETYQPGALNQAQTSPIALEIDDFSVQLGLSICYDLRFPELYRLLVERGAQVVCVPSAFTHETGQAHWQPLLRARAIENQVFVVAPAQGGEHANGRSTWGHSMIIDPWGNTITSEVGDQGLLFSEIDLTQIEALRARFPVHTHRRL